MDKPLYDSDHDRNIKHWSLNVREGVISTQGGNNQDSILAPYSRQCQYMGCQYSVTQQLVLGIFALIYTLKVDTYFIRHQTYVIWRNGKFLCRPLSTTSYAFCRTVYSKITVIYMSLKTKNTYTVMVNSYFKNFKKYQK